MTQEDKNLLLLKDLCARLSYGVKGKVYAETTNVEYDINGDMIFFNSPFDVTLDSINTSTQEIHVVAIGNEDTIDFIEDQQAWGSPYTIDDFKPYLRPMSSMTEEEREEINEFLGYRKEINVFGDIHCAGWNGDVFVDIDKVYGYLNWLNVHHFDYRGLIEKGLALEAPKDMYKTE